MRVIFNSGEQGLSSARNLGVANAKGEIIAFVDDDALLVPGWTEATLKTYRDDDSVIGVTGPVIPLWEAQSMDWFPREFYWIFSCTYWDMEKPTEVRNGYGTNISFRREAFNFAGQFRFNLGCKGREKGGWHEPGAEELDFTLRVKKLTGKHILYNPNIKVRHRVYKYRFSTRFIARRAYWEGYGKAIMNRWYPDTEKNGAVLSVEYGLLNRILFRLLPAILIRLFRRPLIALKQLYITKLVLCCVAAGFLNSEILILLHWSEYYAATE
jgi:glucosyl-dolichyl phosphate glucuronosyltransferase